MDGEVLSCWMDDLLTVSEASVVVSEASTAEDESCFGEDSEPGELWAKPGDPKGTSPIDNMALVFGKVSLLLTKTVTVLT